MCHYVGILGLSDTTGVPLGSSLCCLRGKKSAQAKWLVPLDGEMEFPAHEQELLAGKFWCSKPPGFGWSSVALRPTGTKRLPRQSASWLQVPLIASLLYFLGDLG